MSILAACARSLVARLPAIALDGSTTLTVTTALGVAVRRLRTLSSATLVTVPTPATRVATTTVTSRRTVSCAAVVIATVPTALVTVTVVG